MNKGFSLSRTTSRWIGLVHCLHFELFKALGCFGCTVFFGFSTCLLMIYPDGLTLFFQHFHTKNEMTDGRVSWDFVWRTGQGGGMHGMGWIITTLMGTRVYLCRKQDAAAITCIQATILHTYTNHQESIISRRHSRPPEQHHSSRPSASSREPATAPPPFFPTLSVRPTLPSS